MEDLALLLINWVLFLEGLSTQAIRIMLQQMEKLSRLMKKKNLFFFSRK